MGKDLRDEKRQLKCVLTESEVLQHGRALARLGAELSSVEDEEKEVKAQFKAKKETIQSQINNEARLVNNGYEYREINCTAHLNYPESGKKTIYRDDSGEVVCVEVMTKAEMQPELFDEDMPRNGTELIEEVDAEIVDDPEPIESQELAIVE